MKQIDLITAILPFALANACGRWYITNETVDLVWRNEYEKKQDLHKAIDLKSFYASVECMDRNLDPMTTNLVNSVTNYYQCSRMERQRDIKMNDNVKRKIYGAIVMLILLLVYVLIFVAVCYFFPSSGNSSNSSCSDDDYEPRWRAGVGDI